MYRNIYTIDSKRTVFDAARMLTDRKIGLVFVKKSGQFIGTLTYGDFVTKVMAVGKNPSTITVEEIMSTPIIMINADDTLVNAADLISKHNLKRIAVVDKGEITGVISSNLIGKYIRQILSGKK